MRTIFDQTFKGEWPEDLCQDVTFRRCTFSKMDCSARILSAVVFEDCAFSDVNFLSSRFEDVYIKCVTFRDCDLSDCKFIKSSVTHTQFYGRCQMTNGEVMDSAWKNCSVYDSDLRRIVFTRTTLENCDIRDSDLEGANFYSCSLPEVSFPGSSLAQVRFSTCSLVNTNFSRSRGLLSASQWLFDNFDTDAEGVLIYKSMNAIYTKHWSSPTPGAILTEAVNPDRTLECGCGVNFGTLEWVADNYPYNIWLCRIRWEWLADVCVPFGTDGKARCGKLELIRGSLTEEERTTTRKVELRAREERLRARIHEERG